MPSLPVTRARSAVLTVLVRYRACSPECCSWYHHSCMTWGQLSWLSEVSRSKGQGRASLPHQTPFMVGMVGSNLLHSYHWGQLTCMPTTRDSSTVFPRQGTRPTLLSAATSEKWGQISRVPQPLRYVASSAQSLEINIVSGSCPDKGQPHGL